MVLETIRNTQSSGSITILGSIISGSDPLSLKEYLQNITNVLADDHVCRVLDVSIITIKNNVMSDRYIYV